MRTTASLLMLVFTALAAPVQAQTTLTGHIRDSTRVPVSFANVQLLAHADSSFVRGAVTDEKGDFALDPVGPGEYRLFVSLIGYHDFLSDRLRLSGNAAQPIEPITLRPKVHEMQGLSVEARRSLYEQKGDRLVINVGTSLTLAGSTALDVLKRSPGVIVNEQANAITLLGKAGVRVMINGKLSYLPAEALVQYLAAMSADNIDTIELITSPSAELDAEGNAGYINIVMKHTPEAGLNGSLTASGGYGEGKAGSASVNLSYERSRISLFGSYSFLWNGQTQYINNFRRVIDAAGVTETPTEIERHPAERNNNVRLGIDYRLGGRTTVGALVATYDNRWAMDAVSRLAIRQDGSTITHVHSANDEINHWRHAMGNVNLRHRLTEAGTLSMDVDYLYYYAHNPTTYLNTTTDVGSGLVTEDLLESDKLTPLHIVVAKTDYLTGGSGKWQFGAGVKGAFSRFVNEVEYASLIPDEWAAEAGLASKSRLREDVLALYGKADYQVSSAIALKMGLRYEHTDSNLGSDEEKNLVDRRFGSFFPSVAYSHRLNDLSQFSASYSRRITRPSFSDMAPFLWFLDPTTFFTGNAGLQPAILSAVKMDLTYRDLLASIEYAHEDSSIARFQSRLIPGRNVQLMSPTNFRRTESVTALLGLPVSPTDWWSMQNNVMVIWQEVEGTSNHKAVTLKQKTLRFNSTQNITLPQDFAFEASGFYESASLFGVDRFKPVWGINVGLQRTLLGDKGKLTLAVNDVFNTIKYSGTTGAPGDAFYLDQLFVFRRRTIQLTYSMRFGGGKASQARSTASEEESGRIQ